uniref:Methyltransferase domain-containing protein n=1 Tax=Dunaliella tertiolecta TaxID=3047 RepID=A0A7S3QK87_DUNTE
MPKYHLQSYWEERYKREPGLYDWYQTYTRLSPLISKYVQTKHKVLQIGCGSSPLTQEMVQMGGFKSVHNIDYCQIVINQMRGLHQAIEGLSYAVADARAMPEIPATSFDFVLDKGTLDANSDQAGGSFPSCVTCIT